MTRKSQAKWKKASTRKRTLIDKRPAVAVKKEASSSIPLTPPQDKYELSPSSQAKCRKCGKKIMKGSRRVGIHEVSPRFGVFHRYYHDECFPASAKKTLRLGGATPQQVLSQQLRQRNNSLVTVRERQPLRESLRMLRMAFAQRLQYAPFCVFHDTTLDELVIKMPTTKTEFLAIKGMGPMKYQSFGEPILQVISMFRSLEHKPSSSRTRKPQTSSRQRVTDVIDLASDEEKTKNRTVHGPSRTVDIDDEQMVIESLTMEQIVEQKFKHAKENGYVIAVDI